VGNPLCREEKNQRGLGEGEKGQLESDFTLRKPIFYHVKRERARTEIPRNLWGHLSGQGELRPIETGVDEV